MERRHGVAGERCDVNEHYLYLLPTPTLLEADLKVRILYKDDRAVDIVVKLLEINLYLVL